MATTRQLSFSGGEIAPALYARVDQVKYATGLRTCKNFMVMRHGGVTNRPGTAFIAEVKDSTKTVKLIPFIFNATQTYILEFGDQYMRVHKDGAQLKEAAKTITGATQADPCVITSTAHGYSNGDEVFISGVGGMTELNNRNFKVANVAANTYELQLMDSTDLDATGFTAYTSGGTAEKVFEITTPYLEADLSDLQYVQSADIVTLVHPSYAPADLSRTGDISWSLADIVFGPTIGHPTGITVTPKTSGSETYQYQVTAVDANSNEESLPGTKVGLDEKDISGATQANPVVITATAHGYSNGDEVFISDVKGMTEINDRNFTIANVTANTFELSGEDGTGYDAYIWGGKAAKIKVITGATQTNPVNITVTAHGFSNGDEVFISGIVGMTELNNRRFTVDNVDTNTFDLQGEDGTGYTAYSSDGTAEQTFGITIAATNLSLSNYIDIAWTTRLGAGQYNIYRLIDGQYGWIGVAGGTTFRDKNYNTDAFDTPPQDRQPFDAAGDYPSAATFYQQRLTFGNTNNTPEGVWTSKSALRKNFMISTPLQDDDAVTFELVGRQVNAVRHLIEVGKLLVFTASGEWSISGDAGGVLTPSDINPQHHTENGSGSLPPLVVAGDALYVQARGSVVRNLAFEFETDGYRGNELSIFAAHLFDKFTLVDWAYQQIPHSIVWAVRNDGTLLGLTYVREHAVFGWHRHEFGNDSVENVAVVPEGSEDALYVVVNRTIDGSTKRYIERLYTRQIDDIVDSVFMDSTLTFDGRNTGATTMTLSGGTAWTHDEDLTLTASAAFFNSGDVGNQIHLFDTDGSVLRCKITAFTSTTVVTVRSHKDVPTGLQNTATTSWSKAVDQVGGLWHLEGQDISVFADGFVAANPNNIAYEVVTVTNGIATLDKPFAVIHVGLPITADMETLDIDILQGPSMADKKKNINKVTIFVEDSRGIFAGPDSDNLKELKIRSDEGYDDPVDLATGTVDLNITGQFTKSGRILIRQTDPVPLSVLAVVSGGYLAA